MASERQIGEALVVGSREANQGRGRASGHKDSKREILQMKQRTCDAEEVKEGKMGKEEETDWGQWL